MIHNGWLPVPMASVLAAVVCASAAAKQPMGQTMDQTIHLYQFIRAGHPILLGRVGQVSVHPGPGPGEETVEVGIEVTEALWRDAGPTRRIFEVRRPASPTAQLKFPDPVWGRVKLQAGTRMLLVVTAASPSTLATPVYADSFADPADSTLASVRSVLDTERTVKDRGVLFQKRMAQLRGTTVEKLFAAEALASRGPFNADEQAQVGEALPRAFADERDDYIKLSLGTWLWDGVYRRLGNTGRVNALNATIQAAGSTSEIVRSFALDRLAKAEPQRLRGPGVKASPEVVLLLEARHAAEPDAGTRRHLEEVIAALRR